MREIKFRAWDKDKKQMIDSSQLGLIESINRNPRFEVMQFTGLKDKNGKEIYEGDVLKVKDDNKWNPEEYSYGIVGYEYSSFTLHSVEDIEDFVDMGLFEYVGDGTDKKYIYNKHKLFKVIGNIYENPELKK